MILHKNICCDPSSELSHRDNSDEGSHHMVLMRNKKNYPSITIKYPLLSRALLLRKIKILQSCTGSSELWPGVYYWHLFFSNDYIRTSQTYSFMKKNSEIIYETFSIEEIVGRKQEEPAESSEPRKFVRFVDDIANGNNLMEALDLQCHHLERYQIICAIT